MFKKSFNSAKCKTLLRLAISRIKLLRNKRDIQLKQMKRELAKLLQSNQEQSAHIRVEHIYREQNIMAAYEVIELLCELIAARLPIIESQKQCPIDLREAIASIIFAAPQCSDVPELQQIRSMFSAKYGKEFTAVATELRPDCGVNRVVIQKLSVKGPSGEVKVKLMKDIAAENSVDWDPTALESQFLRLPEDLLEGPSQFFRGSQMPLEKSFNEPSTSEPITPQDQGNVVAEAKTYVDQNTESLDEKQFIPFVRPIGAGSQSTSGIATSHWQSSSSDRSSHVLSATPSYKYNEGVDVRPVIDRKEGLRGEAATARSSHILSATSSHKYGEDEDAKPAFDRRNSLKSVAAAATAAAESAERAAAAARAAAELASQNFHSNTSGSSSDSESDSNGDEVSQLQGRFENSRFRPPDDSESDNHGAEVSQPQARFEHNPFKPGRDPPDDSLTYRRPLFDEPAEGEGLYRKQASGRNLTSYDGPIAGHSVSSSILGKGHYSDDLESASHSTSRLDSKSGRDPSDDSSTYRTPLFDEPADGKGFYRNQTSEKNSSRYDGLIAGHSVSHSIFGKGGYNDDSEKSASHSTSSLDLKPGRDPLDDSLTYRTPLFVEPAEGKGFYTKQASGRNLTGYDGPIAGHSVSHSVFGKGSNSDDSESASHSTDFKPGRGPRDDSSTYRTSLFDEPADGKGFYRNETLGKNSSSYDGPIAGHPVSYSIFGKGGYNDASESASHSTSSLHFKPGRDPLDDSLTYRTPLFDEPSEGKGFYTKQTSGRNLSGYDGLHSVSHSIFGKGGYNDDSESVSDSTSRHGDRQASRHSRTSSSPHNSTSSFRTRSSETAGATPSFADEAAQSTTARPPERTPPELPGAQPPALTKSISFVHPKLPDYESLTAHFQALKAMKSKK